MPDTPEEDLTPDMLSHLRDLARDHGGSREGQRIGHFLLRKQIGQGGMAVVYLAEQENLGRKVAVKFLRRGGNERARTYFEREARMAAAMDHPHIAKIFEVGEHEGTPYIAMQYVEGETFASALLSMDMNQRIHAILDMARALEYAHGRGIIHRDLKPENILVDPTGHVYITDFGLAKLESPGRSAATASSVVVGTPAYMAPEQAQGKADAQSDLYALGAILYQCMTGTTPFQGGTASEILLKVLEEDPVPPRRLNAGVPEDLEAVILHALEKKKEDRYATAGQLVEDLDAFVSGRPVQHARRSTPGYVLGKLFRRQPVLWSLAAGLLVAIGVGIPVGFSLHSRAKEETSRRHELESRRKLEDRMAPLRKQIEETRFFYYIADVDIREKLDGVRKSLDEVASIMEAPGNARFAVGWRALGVGNYFIGNRTRAEEYLLKADRLAPSDPVTNLYLAKICLDRAFQYRTGRLGDSTRERRQKSRRWAERAITLFRKKHIPGGKMQDAIVHTYLAWLEDDFPRVTLLCQQGLEEFEGVPGLEEFWNLKGMVAKGRARERDYTRAIAHRPHYAWGYYMRGNSLFEQGKVDEAVKNFTAALEINPFLEDAFNNRGFGHLALDRPEKALADFSTAIELDPSQATPWNNRGTVLFGMGKEKEALRDYREALKVDPGYSDAHFNWGNLLLARKEYGKAIEKYDRAIGIRSDQADYYHNRAVAKRYRGQVHEAIADYGKTLELDSHHAVALYQRAQLWQMLEEWKKALDDLSRAIRIDPEYADAFYERGYLLWRMNNVPGAIRDYSRTIQLEPGNTKALLNRGAAWMRTGEREKAVADYSRAIEIDPGKKTAWYNRGNAFSRLGKYQRAIHDYTEALKLDPDYAEAWTNRADAHLGLDQREEGIRDLEKALEVAPPGWPYREKVQKRLEKLRKEI